MRQLRTTPFPAARSRLFLSGYGRATAWETVRTDRWVGIRPEDRRHGLESCGRLCSTFGSSKPCHGAERQDHPGKRHQSEGFQAGETPILGLPQINNDFRAYSQLGYSASSPYLTVIRRKQRGNAQPRQGKIGMKIENAYLCENCQQVSEADGHGRCGVCGSSALLNLARVLNRNSREEILNFAPLVTARITADEGLICISGGKSSEHAA